MKKNLWKKYIVLIGVLFLFPLGMLILFGVLAKHNFQTPPYLGPKTYNGSDTVYYTLPAFSLHDQNGRDFSSESLKGKFWLAAFFSVTDTNLAKITKRLLYFNERYTDQPDIQIVCFHRGLSADSTALRDYVEQIPVYAKSWNKVVFLYDSSNQMDSLLKNIFLIKDLTNEAIFWLVDHEGHLRGSYGNTEYHMGDAIGDVGMVKKAYDKKVYDEKKE